MTTKKKGKMKRPYPTDWEPGKRKVLKKVSLSDNQET